MKLHEQSIYIQVPRRYAKPYAQKIKNIIWTRFESTSEVEDLSFDGDETSEVMIYFLSTNEQLKQLQLIIQTIFADITFTTEKD